MVIASWLLAVDVNQVDQTRASLQSRPGIECRSEVRGRLVVLSECRSADLDNVHAMLRSAPGVSDAALVAALEDDDGVAGSDGSKKP